jgi:outer membrane efflux protein
MRSWGASRTRFELAEIRAVLEGAVGDPGFAIGPLDGDLAAAMPKIDPGEWRGRLLRESPSLQEVRAEIAQDETALAVARRAPQGAGTAAAAAKLAEDRLRAEQVRLTLEISFAETYAGYQSAVQQLATYRGGVLERAERAYAESLKQYQQGTTAYPQVLIARRTLFQLEDGELEALVKAWSAAIDIQALLPYQLPQNLAPPHRRTPGAGHGSSRPDRTRRMKLCAQFQESVTRNFGLRSAGRGRPPVSRLGGAPPQIGSPGPEMGSWAPAYGSLGGKIGNPSAE